MITLSLLAPTLILAAFLWRKERQLESILKASELALKAAHEQAAEERTGLLTRIQAPELANLPEVNTQNGGITFESDDQYWAATDVEDS